jgi:enoyl-CoA hydratase/carnithine racemase
MTAQLLTQRDNTTLVLTISNSEARNALHPDIYAAGQEALSMAAGDKEIPGAFSAPAAISTGC